jgi:HD-like signal output (HDOD) protein
MIVNGVGRYLLERANSILITESKHVRTVATMRVGLCKLSTIGFHTTLRVGRCVLKTKQSCCLNSFSLKAVQMDTSSSVEGSDDLPQRKIVASSLNGRELLTYICQSRSLPSLPAVAAETLFASGRPDCDLEKLADIIAKDPPLVARILRTVNSSYYALRQPIASVAQALLILGIKHFRMLVAGHSVIPAIKRCGPQDPFQLSCSRRALYASTAARLISEKLRVSNADSCFLAALLMDIGVLAMAQVPGLQYAEILKAADRHADLEPLELEKFGITHAIVAAELTRRSKLPEDVATAIQFHHSPDQAGAHEWQVMARVLRQAGFCADVFLDHNPLWPIAEVYRLGAEGFGADKPTFDEILENLAGETRKLGATFDVQVEEDATVERSQLRALAEFKIDAQPLSPPDAQRGVAAGDDNRREIRVCKKGTITLYPCTATAQGTPVKASLSDVSPSGIGLLLVDPLPPGSQFAVGIRRGVSHAIVILYEVRHSRRNDDDRGYLIGGELIRAVRERDLLANPLQESPLFRIGRSLLARGIID